jgi:hypothetical protein
MSAVKVDTLVEAGQDVVVVLLVHGILTQREVVVGILFPGIMSQVHVDPILASAPEAHTRTDTGNAVVVLAPMDATHVVQLVDATPASAVTQTIDIGMAARTVPRAATLALPLLATLAPRAVTTPILLAVAAT